MAVFLLRTKGMNASDEEEDEHVEGFHGGLHGKLAGCPPEGDERYGMGGDAQTVEGPQNNQKGVRPDKEIGDETEAGQGVEDERNGYAHGMTSERSMR